MEMGLRLGFLRVRGSELEPFRPFLCRRMGSLF
jgi:hypothetical protein